MRICFVSHGSGRGGAEEVLLETIECLKERNFDCRVLMPGDNGLGEDLKKLDVPFKSLPYWTWMGHNKSIWERTQTAARNVLLSVPGVIEVQKWNPDIIFSNTMTVCFGAILATVMRRPHVWHLHEIGYEDHGLTFDFGPKLSYKVIDSLSTACIAVSKITADRFARHINPSKLTVIYPSVHRTAYWPGSNGQQQDAVPPRRRKLRCVIVGRLSEGKRQVDSVLAFAELKQKGIDAELLIVGRSNPGYKEKLEKLVREHGLERHVSVIGAVVDRLPFVQSADIILMCSRCEAFGRVTVEGMLAGKAVIAANSGANPELIHDGVNGLMYKMGDTSEMAAKIQYLSENPDLAKRLGENARIWSHSFFTKERYARETISLLTSVLEQHGSTPVGSGTPL